MPVASAVTHPDLPSNLIACATASGISKAPEKKGADGKPIVVSADAKVASLKKLADDRRACAIAIVGWYKKLQAASQKADAPAKPAGA